VLELCLLLRPLGRLFMLVDQTYIIPSSVGTKVTVKGLLTT